MLVEDAARSRRNTLSDERARHPRAAAAQRGFQEREVEQVALRLAAVNVVNAVTAVNT